jgi:hypothetical protein
MNSPELQNPSAKARLIECLSISSLLALARFVELPLAHFVHRYEQWDERQHDAR